VLHWSTRIALGAAALGLFAAAAFIDGAFWLRHVVEPACYLPPPPWMHAAARAGLLLAGLLLVAAAVLIKKPTAAGAVRSALAFLLALVASELALRVLERPERRARHPRIEWMLGAKDPRTGWAFVPGGSLQFGAPGGGPVVEYAVDAHGDRAPSTTWKEDDEAPTLLVTGESIAVGHGLVWQDTFAAQAAARMGLQVVNVAEGGYGSDQALFRARDALQRLRHPVALVSTVLPVQLHRNLNDARPHLELSDGMLVLEPPVRPRILLRELIVDELQFLPEFRLRRSLALTRAILEETARIAREHGARPLFVAPLFGPETALVGEMLEGLPHVIVSIDPARIMPWDGHPDAQGARQIADAVVSELEAPARD
jgi:hypothetical protein